MARSERRKEPRYLSPDERRAAGRVLRQAAPREAHADWTPPKDRRDPIELLNESNEGRLEQLIPIRFGRMMQSPFAFYRGSASIMAADLASTPASGIRVQTCGDAHLANFGGFATPERRIIFDINDFDETLPGPWEWDVKRLAASFILAGRHIRLSESASARAVRTMLRSYREHVADYSEMRALEVWYDTINVDRFLAAIEAETEGIRARVEARLKRLREKNTPEFLFPKLVQHQGTTPKIIDDPPLIFHPSKELAPDIEKGFASYRESLSESLRTLYDRYHLCDLAMKVVGVGSVGTQCAVGLFMASDDDPIFLQVKEAGASVLEPHVGSSVHLHHGQRVVEGQRLMQSASDLFLGWGTGANGRQFYVRQLRDMKISAIIEDFNESDLRAYGTVCGWALARAHARSGDIAMIAGYLGSSDAFDRAACEFAREYADQAQRDYRAFVRGVREGRIQAADAL